MMMYYACGSPERICLMNMAEENIVPCLKALRRE
jgi:hypothetical protein